MFIVTITYTQPIEASRGEDGGASRMA